MPHKRDGFVPLGDIAGTVELPGDRALTPAAPQARHHFTRLDQIPPVPARQIKIPKPTQVVQVMSDKEIAEKRNPDLRLPRQAEHYSQIVGHFLAVKNSPEIAVAIQAHFQRLEKYHRQLLGIPTDDVEDDEPDE